jgi:hypothetical protein
MFKPRLTKIALLTVLFALSAPLLVGAQTSADKLSGEFSVLDEEIGSLSMAEMQQNAKNNLQEMKSNLDATRSLLKQVRTAKEDISKVNCVNNRLATMKGLTKISENSMRQLEGMVANGDRSGAKHYYKLIAVAHKKMTGLVDEAQMCTGQFAEYGDAPQVEFEIDNERLEETQTAEGAMERTKQKPTSDSPFSSATTVTELTPYY